MEHHISKDYIYTNGAARFGDLVYLAIRDRKLLEQDVEHSVMIAFDRGELGDLNTLEWTSIDSCVVKSPEECLLTVGEDGQVYTYVGGKSDFESITQDVRALRSVTAVDGVAYACGMGWQVFQRENKNNWREMHVQNVGFKGGLECVTGHSRDELYAVGWGGMIFRREDGAWRDCVSPTNQILTRACVGIDGEIYAVGHRGTIVRGRGDSWVSVLEDELAEDLWDICFFNDNMYISSFSSIYRFDGDSIELVDFGNDAPETTYRLTAAEGVLWSIGSDNVFSFDGTDWVRLD